MIEKGDTKGDCVVADSMSEYLPKVVPCHQKHKV